jgi:predicted glycosyltransferase
VRNDHYASRWLRVPVSDIRALRSELLRVAVRSFHPNVVLVDKHPLGAKGEFRDALDELRWIGGRAVLGLRDILDEPDVVRREWAAYRMQARIEEYFDLLLVYGERSVFDPIASYGFLPTVAERTRFCGYVVNHDNANSHMDNGRSGIEGGTEKRARPLVLGTTGGGEDGFRLLETFIRASARAPWEAVAISGPMLPEHDFLTLTRLAAGAGVSLHKFMPNISGLFWSADALVCMGGYNTLVEAAATGLPIICVPRSSPRLEQVIRAKAFERLGLASMILPEMLAPDSLRQAIHTSLQRSRHDQLVHVHSTLDFDGARTAARHLLGLAQERACTGPVAPGRVKS